VSANKTFWNVFKSTEKFNELIGNQIQNFPVCSKVPQTELYRLQNISFLARLCNTVTSLHAVTVQLVKNVKCKISYLYFV
jgi:hypothetical protein